MLYSLQNYSLLFYNELYVNFSKNYIKLNEYFYSFPTESFVVGVWFGEKEDARVFNTLVQQYSISKNELKAIK